MNNTAMSGMTSAEGSPLSSALAMPGWVTENFENQSVLGFPTTQTLFEGQSAFQHVALVDTPTWGRMLLLDGRIQTTQGDEFVYHELISHVPLCAHPSPKRVLIIGGGDGGTVREVLKHPEVESVVLCEIDGMVVDVCRQYLPDIAGAITDPMDSRVTVAIEDGLAMVDRLAQAGQPAFEVVIIDSSDPVGPGEGLFTEAFYRQVSQILTDDGIMVAQTGPVFYEQALFASLYPFYRAIFPHVSCYLGHIPTYPGGLWSWCFASKHYTPQLTPQAQQKAQHVAASCRYYTPAIHQSCLTLPRFVETLLQTIASP